MFLTGLIIGLIIGSIIGAAIGFLACALCVAAHNADVHIAAKGDQ